MGQIELTNSPTSHTYTEYYKATCYRIDTEQSGTYSIADPANKRFVMVDPAKQEYSTTVPAVLRSLRTDESRTVVIEIETRHTGEERQMFGHSARHCVTTQHRRTESPDRTVDQGEVLVTDGWYLDLPVAVPSHSLVGAIDVFRAGPNRLMPKVNITRCGPTVHGLAVLGKDWLPAARCVAEEVSLRRAARSLDRRTLGQVRQLTPARWTTAHS